MTLGTIATLEALPPTVPERSRPRARLVAALTRLGGVAGREAATREYADEAVRLGRRLAMPEVEIEGLYALIVPAPDPELAADRIDRRLVDRLRSLPLAGARERAIATEIDVVIADEEGGDAAAAAVLRGALARARDDGALRRVAYLADGLATRLLAMDRAAVARPLAVEAVEAARDIGDVRLEMFGLETLATASAWAAMMMALAGRWPAPWSSASPLEPRIRSRRVCAGSPWWPPAPAGCSTRRGSAARPLQPSSPCDPRFRRRGRGAGSPLARGSRAHQRTPLVRHRPTRLAEPAWTPGSTGRAAPSSEPRHGPTAGSPFASGISCHGISRS